jgi:mono/diheme cytochrome c family protein
MRPIPLAAILALALAAADGRVLYETKCAQCHGKDGVAKPPGKGSKDFNDPAFQSAWNENAIAAITSDGKGKMPGYKSRLTPEQIQSVAAHVKTLGPAK